LSYTGQSVEITDDDQVPVVATRIQSVQVLYHRRSRRKKNNKKNRLFHCIPLMNGNENKTFCKQIHPVGPFLQIAELCFWFALQQRKTDEMKSKNKNREQI